MKVRNIFGVFKTAAQDFSADSCPRLGASLAYYTIFSLSPWLLIVIAIASFFFGAEAARGELFGQISGMVGPKGAEAIQSMLSSGATQKHGLIATIIATVTLILGSTGVFLELQASLNTIWGVKQEPGAGIWSFIRHRLISFAMVLTIGFLLLVSLVLTAAIAAVGKMLGGGSPGMEVISQVLNFAASFAVVKLLFALIFKLMPDVKIPWHTVWVGGAFTSLLFTVGKFALGLYLGKSSAASAFGAAGSLVALLLWVYYSAQIMFFGAEITQAWAKAHNVQILPKEHAKVDEENSNKEQSPTQGAPSKPAPSAQRAPRPQPAAPLGPLPRPGFVMPALLLVAALFLPGVRKHHS